MTAVAGKIDLKALARAADIVGQIFCECALENKQVKRAVVFKIGARTWCFTWPSVEADRTATLTTIAQHAIADIIVALRMETEKMLAKLGDQFVARVPENALVKGANLDALAWTIMRTEGGVTSSTCLAVTSVAGETKEVLAVAYLCGGYLVCDTRTDKESEEIVPTIIAKLGPLAVIRMLAQYDQIFKRYSSRENAVASESKKGAAEAVEKQAEKRKRDT
jgi:hypothetical protein